MPSVDRNNENNRALFPRIKPEVERVDVSAGTEIPEGILRNGGSLRRTPTDHTQGSKR